MKHLFASAVVVTSICIFVLVGALSLSKNDFPFMHDDGIYAITAKSLAETGEYRITSLPGEPFQHKYPIAFPAVVSIVWRVWPDFPGNIVALKSVSLAAGVVFLAFAYLLLSGIRGISHVEAAVIVAICAVAPATCELANNVMSELLYGALTLASLWLLDREMRHSVSPFPGVVIGALGGGAFLTRSVGISLVVAIIGGLVLWRNWRLLSMTALGLALVIVPARVWGAPVSHVGRSYEYYVNYGDWFRHTATDVGPQFFVWVPIKNLFYSVIGLSGTLIPARLDIFPAGNLLNFVLLGLVIAGSFAVLFTTMGLFHCVWQSSPAVWSLYLSCYLILLLIWPFPPPPRFFVPVLPLIILACREGMMRTGWFTAKSLRSLLAGVGLLSLLTSSGLSAVERIRIAKIPVKMGDQYTWIVQNSTPVDVIACIDDTKCYLVTGRKSVSIGIPEFAAMYGSDNRYRIRPETILEMLKESQAKLLMVEETRWTKALEQLAFDAVEQLRLHHPQLLEEVWRDTGETAVIYRVIHPDYTQTLVP